MFRAAILFCILATTAAAEHCEDGTQFDEQISGMIDDGSYEAGYTSGYRKLPGKYRFEYCVRNLSDTAPFEFLWKGPRPSPLLKGQLSYGRSKAKGWKEVATSYEQDVRELGIGLGSNMDYHDVDTFFKSAWVQAPRIFRTQGSVEPDVSSFAGFSNTLEALRESNPDQTGLSYSSGVEFLVPSNPEEWEMSLTDGAPKSEPVLVTAWVRLTYDFESLNVDMSTNLAVRIETASESIVEDLFQSFELLHPGFDEIGFDALSEVKFQEGDSIKFQNPLTRDQFVGVRQARTVFNIGKFSNDTRPPQVSDVPVEVLFAGRPIFVFNAEALAAPIDP
jgi:hypothetical protein